MLGPMAAAGGEIPRAVLVEAIPYRAGGWRPDTGAAKVGDVVVRLGQIPPEIGWTLLENSIAYWRVLTAGDLTTTFGASNPYMVPVFVVLRNVRSVVQRVRASVALNTTVAGFPRDPLHAGLLIATNADPYDFAEPTIWVGSTPVAGTVRYYSPPDQGNSAQNLHCYLAANFPEYQTNQSFKGSTGSALKSAFITVLELLGG